MGSRVYSNIEKKEGRVIVDEKRKLIERVKKLLALGDPSRNDCEAEVQAAIKAAKRIMAEHGLSMAEVSELEAGQGLQIGYVEVVTSRLQEWEHLLTKVIENICGISALAGKEQSDPRKKTIIFCGTESDVSVGREMYLILRKIIRENGRRKFPPKKVGFSALRSYCEGFAYTLLIRSEEEVQFENKKDSQKWGIVLADKKNRIESWVRQKLKPRQESFKNKRADVIPFMMGMVDGADVNLRTKGLLRENMEMKEE